MPKLGRELLVLIISVELFWKTIMLLDQVRYKGD